MAQDLLPGRLGLDSGLMVGFALGTGGLGITLQGIVADAWGVPAALSAMAFMPPLGLLPSLFLPAATLALPGLNSRLRYLGHPGFFEGPFLTV